MKVLVPTGIKFNSINSEMIHCSWIDNDDYKYDVYFNPAKVVNGLVNATVRILSGFSRIPDYFGLATVDLSQNY